MEHPEEDMRKWIQEVEGAEERARFIREFGLEDELGEASGCGGNGLNARLNRAHLRPGSPAAQPRKRRRKPIKRNPN